MGKKNGKRKRASVPSDPSPQSKKRKIKDSPSDEQFFEMMWPAIQRVLSQETCSVSEVANAMSSIKLDVDNKLRTVKQKDNESMYQMLLEECQILFNKK